MLLKKNNFFFIFLLPILAAQMNTCVGSMFTRFFSIATCRSVAAGQSLMTSLSLHYQMLLKTRALHKLEKSHKKQLTNKLTCTEHTVLDKKATSLFWKNYFIQEQHNAISLKNKFFKHICGTKFISKEKEQFELYNKLCAQKEDIFLKAYREVYKKEYYHLKSSLLDTKRELNDQIPIKCLQKLMD